jgi:hypothetical protein
MFFAKSMVDVYAAIVHSETHDTASLRPCWRRAGPPLQPLLLAHSAGFGGGVFSLSCKISLRSAPLMTLAAFRCPDSGQFFGWVFVKRREAT